MNFIRLLRTATGLTQTALALRGNTSQPTIALYESGAKSPNLSTLINLAKAVEKDVVIQFVPIMSREDKRSLAFHQAIAEKIRQNPSACINKAKQNLQVLQTKHKEANLLWNQWKKWLNMPVESLVQKILDPGISARDLRQVSPFSGLLTPKERLQILKNFQKEMTYEQERV
ncbi:MAG: putative transcriptional regulatory protein [uncultured bacterium]|nr:MAG: putative transcriptional regulatory protein [uncultured bacterium]